VPEFIDPVFAKTSPIRSFSVLETSVLVRFNQRGGGPMRAEATAEPTGGREGRSGEVSAAAGVAGESSERTLKKRS